MRRLRGRLPLAAEWPAGVIIQVRNVTGKEFRVGVVVGHLGPETLSEYAQFNQSHLKRRRYQCMPITAIQ
jgi:hypothetical protein